MADENIIVYTDKTVVKVQGLDVKGLDTRALEKILMDKFHSVVRIIGVTGSSIDMDIYGIDPEQIQKDEHGLIQAISTTEGVTATELAKLAGAEKIVPVDINHIPQRDHDYCARERWLHHD